MLVYQSNISFLKKAVDSILTAGRMYPHCHLSLIDTSLDQVAVEVVHDTLMTDINLENFSVYQLSLSKDQIKTAGNQLGYAMNRAIMDSDAAIALVVPAWNIVHPHYFGRLVEFFLRHPNATNCYSHIIPYNPYHEEIENIMIEVRSKYHPLNKFKDNINDSVELDISQIAWKTHLNKESKLWFMCSAENMRAISRRYQTDVYDKCQSMPHTGFYSQYIALEDTLSTKPDHPDVDEMMGHARECFFKGRTSECINLVHKILKITGGEYVEARNLLEQIYEMDYDNGCD